MTAPSSKLVGQLDPQSLFVWVSTSQISWINKSMTPNCKEIGPNKRPASSSNGKILLNSLIFQNHSAHRHEED